MEPIYRPGYWCDVCVRPDGTFVHVTTEGALIRVYSGSISSASGAPEPLGFCRCAADEHAVYSIHQGRDTGTAWLHTPQGWKSLGLTYGVQPVAIDAVYAYVVRSTRSYDRIRLATGEIESLAHGVPGSSQGISDVEPDGTIRWADTSRTEVIDGRTLTYPNERGQIIVAQMDPPQIGGVAQLFDENGDPYYEWFTAFPGLAFEPHLARSGDRYVACARTPEGAAYIEIPPFPAFISISTPPPAPDAPAITITDYAPKSGTTPLTVTVTLEKSGGPATDSGVLLDGERYPSQSQDATHRQLVIGEVGTHNLGAWIEGPGGRNQTGLPRPITVTPKEDPVPQVPLRGSRVWFMPNIASNILDLFPDDDSKSVLGNVDIFEFSAQHFDGNPSAGPNQYSALVAADAFRKLRRQGINTSVGMGVIKEWDPTGEKNIANLNTFFQQVRDAGGELGYVSMDEPLTGNRDFVKQPLEVIADRVAPFVKRAHELGLKVAWEEAWPHIDVNDMWRFLDLLDERSDNGEALPDYWHLDIDHKLKTPDAAFITTVKDIVEDFAIQTSVILAGYKHPTDAEYKQDVLAWADQIKALGIPNQRLLLMSWVEGFTQPQNFEHIDLLNQVVERNRQ
jgi:hypothetical protein